MKRRPFLKIMGSAAGAYSLGLSAYCWAEEKRVEGIPYRKLGRTGESISILVFPGLALNRQPQEDCTEAVHQALDQGINYYDVAPAYGDAEIKMGEALVGLDRSRYLLACKTKVRDKEGARKEFEQSLVRLKTDYFDVYQLHHLHTAEDVKKAFGPNGVMEMITEAKKEGKIRFVGFSAHTTKSALDAMSQYAFDTVMFPINFIEYYQFGFGQEVLAEAQKQGAGVLAIKPMCGGLWGEKEERTRQWWYKPLEERREINMALRFTLSLPGVTAGVAPGMLDLFPKALEVVKIYQPSTEEEKRELEGMAKERISVFQADQKNYAYGDPSHYYA